MLLIYNASIRLFYVLIWISSLTQSKTKKWIRGRKNLFHDLSSYDFQNQKIAWFHCASLGEFEQGRPIIEQFKVDFPEYKIVLTFFSPSGYEVRKDYPGADYICYLPLDTPGNAKRFIETINPKVVVFIKYEFWFNFLKYLKVKNIPVLFVSSIFRPGQIFFKWYGAWFRNQIKGDITFFVQNKASTELLETIGIKKHFMSGDTRFDRVHKIKQLAENNLLIEKFIQGENKTILIGSSWPEDEKMIHTLLKNLPQKVKLIIAPHEIDENRIREIHQLFPGEVVNYTGLTTSESNNYNVLCVNTIGLLSSIYQYADIAFIGGGFGKGIHNILEAAAVGKPIMFGPNYQKFAEAVDLIELKAAFTVSSADEGRSIIHQLFTDKDLYNKASKFSKEYVEKKIGATEIIMNYIKTRLY